MEINCLHFDILGSTNVWSKENYKNFDPQKITQVTADRQTAGHGRYKRPWVSPAGQNIYASFTFFIPAKQKNIENLTQIFALSVAKTLEEFGFHPQLKWPNDIQINKKKVAGLLCEIVSENDLFVVIIGIGLNINMPLEELAQISQPATSLLAESGQEFKILDVLRVLQQHICDAIDLFMKEGFKCFLKDYQKYLVHQKGDVIQHANQKGIFHSIDSDGALVLQQEDGSLQKFFAGEIGN